MSLAEKTMQDAQACNAFLRVFDPPLVEAQDGPLSGSRISVKDNVSLAGYPTTGACPAFETLVLPENGSVTRLKEAGAAIVGKTNLHELAFGITGANAHTGDTLNPVNKDYLTGGSSAGAAASVATGACEAAIGTDTGGSCRIPAAHCGIVGYRPSIGRYDGAGILTLSKTRDTLGLLTKDMATLRRVDGVMALAGAQEHQVQPEETTLGLVEPSAFFPVSDPAVLEAYEAGVAALKAAGFQTKAIDLSAAIAAHEGCGFAIALYETAQSMATFARDHLGLSLADFAERIASADVRGLIESQAGPDAVPEAMYREAMEVHLPALRQAFVAALSGVDALVYPCMPVGPVQAGSGEMMHVAGQDVPAFPATTAMTGPDSTAGQPSITLPCGTANGFPTGLMLVGAVGADDHLLAIAASAEAALGERA
ncbi:MAG: amidase family protein [Pseudomonadota bacterium]